MNTFAFCVTLLSVCGAISGAFVPGGKTAVTDDETYYELTKNVSMYMKEMSAGTFGVKLEFVRGYDATVQVVAGVLYEMNADVKENGKVGECKVSVYEKSWENFVKMDVVCGNGQRKYSFAKSYYNKVEEIAEPVLMSGMVGGKTEVTSQKTLNVLAKNITKYMKELSATGFGVQLEFVEMKSATVQVVSGVLYDVVADVKENGTIDECTIALWVKPWIQGFVKMDVTCGNGQRKYSFAKSGRFEN